MIGNLLREALRAMAANKLRTFLTMLGMVIGVGAVILMLAIGQGAQFVVKQTIATLGSNLFIVQSGTTAAAGVRTGGGNAPTLTVGDARGAGRAAHGGRSGAGASRFSPARLRRKQLELFGQRRDARLLRRAQLARGARPAVHRNRPALDRSRRAAGTDRGAGAVPRRGPGGSDNPHSQQPLPGRGRAGAQGPELRRPRPGRHRARSADHGATQALRHAVRRQRALHARARAPRKS